MYVRGFGSAFQLCAMGALSLAACGGSSATQGNAVGTRSWLGPQFSGGGNAGLGQSIAAGLSALDCGDPSTFSFTNGPVAGAQSHLTCFYDTTDQTQASVEWIIESAADVQLVHARLTLNPAFVDNTYGANAIGWPTKMGPAGKAAPMGPAGMAKPPMAAKAAHSFMDLVGSDHAEWKLSDASGNLVLHFKEDYISQVAGAPSGYASLGVNGGDGKMLQGDANDVVAVSTSLDRNLNACHLAGYTVDSPPTDADYTPVRGAEAWDYRVVYDVWVRASAFGSPGFGEAVVDFVHASPSKGEAPTTTVARHRCPPDWKRYCADPNGCTDHVCGAIPDEWCTDASVPMSSAGRGSAPEDPPL